MKKLKGSKETVFLAASDTVPFLYFSFHISFESCFHCVMMSTGDEPLSPFIVVPGVRFQSITEHVRDDIEITIVASFDLMSHTT